MSDEYAIYFIVKNNLSMGKGKIAGQVGHAMQYIMEDYMKGSINQYDYQSWKDSGHRKIVLKTDQNQLERLAKYKNSVAVHDAGKTQIPSNSLTVVAYYPMK